MRREDRLHLWALGIILLVATLVRIAFVSQPMRYDEAFNFIKYASQSVAVILTDYEWPNNQVLHTLAVHASRSLLGDEPWVLRLPGLVAGVLLVLASYVAARALYEKHTGLLTAALVAASSPLIEYSTNARGYTMLCLDAMALLALAAFLTRSPDRAAWAAFAVLAALGFYTVPGMVYPFGMLVIWLLLSMLAEPSSPERALRLRRLCIAVCAAAVLTALLYAPILLVSGPGALLQDPAFVRLPWSEATAGLIRVAAKTWSQWNRDIPWLVQLALVAGFCVSLILHGRLARHGVPVVLAAAAWIVPLVWLQRTVTFKRLWLFLAPMYLMLASAGIAYLVKALMGRRPARRSVAFVVLAVLLAVGLSANALRTRSVYYSTDTGVLRDAEAITLDLKQWLRPDDRVVALCPSDMPLAYYFHLHEVELRHLFGSPLEGRRLFVVVNRTARQTLDEVLDKRSVTGINRRGAALVREYQTAGVYRLDR